MSMGRNRGHSAVPVLLKCAISALMRIVLNDVAFLSSHGLCTNVNRILFWMRDIVQPTESA